MIKESCKENVAALSQKDPKIGSANDILAEQTITFHHYVGNSGKSSSPAHWHKDIEIMHFISGVNFTHICQCRSVTFSAPAIVIVPSNFIHRTRYPARCKVKRILFTANMLRLHEGDSTLDESLNLLINQELRGSIVLQEKDDVFSKVQQLLHLLEDLYSSHEEEHYDPSRAQEDSIEQDKVDAFIAATFANIGSKEAQLHQIDALDKQQKNLQELTVQRPNIYPVGNILSINRPYDGVRLSNIASKQSSINAGSIAIANAPGYQEHHNKRGRSKTFNPQTYLQNPVLQLQCVNLQTKAFLINIISTLFEYGYLQDHVANLRQKQSRANDDKIKELLKYIHDHYNYPLNIKDLAIKLNVTNQYFCRFFKQLTDMSFVDYLNDLRLQKSAIDIATTQQSIREISIRHGFETIGYFFKLFREHYKTTPMGYRSRFIDGVVEEDKKEEAELMTLSTKEQYYTDANGVQHPIPSIVARDLKESRNNSC